MEANIKKSRFQLKNQRLINVEFNLNDTDDDTLSLEVEINVRKAEDKNIACVELGIFVNKDDLTKNINIIVKNEGFFEWEELTSEEVDIYLEQNAPAVLLSFIRSTISNLTVAAGINPIILPLLNFSK